jgi:hypothetical protein
MKVRRFLTLVVLSGSLAAAGAFAAPPADKPSKPEDLRMLRDFSRCLAKESPAQARRILRLDYRTDAYRRSIRNLAVAIRPCRPFTGSLRLSGVLLAGGLAEALMPAALGGRTLVSAAAFDPTRPPLTARDDGEYLGLCAVRTMPGQVAQLLATAPASEEEKQAVRGLTSGLGTCVREGASATLNRPGLRAVLALAAYRVVSEPVAAPGRSSGAAA